MPGERVGGDAALVLQRENGTMLAIVDALGHGPLAHEVACRAEALLQESEGSDPVALLGVLHETLRGSRGAAAGLGWVANRQIVYAGIGNTVCRCFGSAEQRLISRDGVLGERMRPPPPQVVSLAEGDTILLYTDGVRTHFGLEEYPLLRNDAPEQVARTVVERFGKAHDDAACVAVRVTS